jgi:hypothetical protein
VRSHAVSWAPAWCSTVIVFVSVALHALPGADTFSRSPLPPGVKAIAAPGLHNVFSLGTNLFSGSSPASDDAFKALSRLGVKTILSVDGARPDVENARKHGLRYVHLPHGYDGISSAVQHQLINAAKSLPGPIYIHCHHGKHRGPAAAAIVCMANDGWNLRQAEQWLVAAGTATNYTGLYDSVRSFSPSAFTPLRYVPLDLPEAATLSKLVDSMVAIDERWEHLRAVQSAGYRAPRAHPDLQPANEALILKEHFRETARLTESAERGSNFVQMLNVAELEAGTAEALLRRLSANSPSNLTAQLDSSFSVLAASCVSCHKQYRDRPHANAPAGKLP